MKLLLPDILGEFIIEGKELLCPPLHTSRYQLRVTNTPGFDVDEKEKFLGKLTSMPIDALHLQKFDFSHMQDTALEEAVPRFGQGKLRALWTLSDNARGCWEASDTSLQQRIEFVTGIAQCTRLESLQLGDITRFKWLSVQDSEQKDILTALSNSLGSRSVFTTLTHFGLQNIIDLDTIACGLLASGLKHLIHLRRLELRHCLLTGEHLKTILTALGVAIELRAIDVSYNDFGSAGIEFMYKLEPFATLVLPHIEEFSAIRCNLPYGATVLAEQVDKRKKSKAICELLSRAPRLNSLNFSENVALWPAVEALANALLKHARHGEWRLINIGNFTKVTTDIFDVSCLYRLISENPNLETFGIANVFIPPYAEVHFARVIATHRRLAHLDINHLASILPPVHANMRLEMNNYFSLFRWLFLGRVDKGSVISMLPMEVLFSYVIFLQQNQIGLYLSAF